MVIFFYWWGLVGKREFTDGEVDKGRQVIAEEVDDEDEGKQQQKTSQ